MARHAEPRRCRIRRPPRAPATPFGKLEAEGVIQRQRDDGFPLDQSRVAYLRYLRRERRQSPRGEADADFQRAKSELIRLRIAEKQRHLILLDEAISHMDELVGLFISRLSGFAARCGGRDLVRDHAGGGRL